MHTYFRRAFSLKPLLLFPCWNSKCVNECITELILGRRQAVYCTADGGGAAGNWLHLPLLWGSPTAQHMPWGVTNLWQALLQQMARFWSEQTDQRVRGMQRSVEQAAQVSWRKLWRVVGTRGAASEHSALQIPDSDSLKVPLLFQSAPGLDQFQLLTFSTSLYRFAFLFKN